MKQHAYLSRVYIHTYIQIYIYINIYTYIRSRVQSSRFRVRNEEARICQGYIYVYINIYIQGLGFRFQGLHVRV